jgi:methylated-DNA-[protein]-cysteine S-methyltransferase
MSTAPDIPYHRIQTPVGVLSAAFDTRGKLTQLWRLRSERRDAEGPEPPALAFLRRQLASYFAGTLRDFNIPMELEGTDFQKRVWKELQRIPYGQTISYLEMARRLGDEKCIRAAARANGANPVVILVPCHRVIGSDGSLVGYGAGLDMKEHLLQLEGILPRSQNAVQQRLFD